MNSFGIMVIITNLLLLSIYFIYAFRNGKEYPWELFFYLSGLVFIDAHLIINEKFRIGVIWIIVVSFLFTYRKRLKAYFFGIKNILVSSIIGIFFGFLLSLAFYFSSHLFLLSHISINQLLGAPVLPIIENVLSEEILFRSILLGCLIYHGTKDSYANMIQALLFTISHLPRYGIENQGSILIWILLLGIITGYTTYKQKNLLGAFWIHFLFNLLNY